MRHGARAAGYIATVTLFSALALLALGPGRAQATDVRIVGNADYSVSDDLVTLKVDRVQNFDLANRSSALRLELWAFEGIYPHDQTGYKLAQYDLGRLVAGDFIDNVRSDLLPFVLPPEGVYNVTLQLTESRGASSYDEGFVARDFQNGLHPVVATSTRPLTVPVIEFYNASLDHYFMSAAPDEINALDTGQIAGWVRTGEFFTVYTQPVAGTNPVCRFYLPPPYGNSHFFSAWPDECAQVQAGFPFFVYESPAVFFIFVPDPVAGACSFNLVPVYRVWNHRPDTDHRYLTDKNLRDLMLTRGFIAEGIGDGIAMCALP